MLPRVSVIIPARNAATTLALTLASVQAQTLPQWEALVINDGSTDHTAAIVARMATADPRIRLLQGSAQGSSAARARNVGINAAQGRYIAFLDADDLWLPEKLAMQIPMLDQGAPLVFSAYQRFAGPDGTPLGTIPARSTVRHSDALDGNPIGCLTAVWDSHHFGRAHMPDVALQEDYAFWLMLLRSGATAVGLPHVLARYRVAPGSASANKLRAACGTWSVLRAQPDLSLPRAALGFTRYALGASLRRLSCQRP